MKTLGECAVAIREAQKARKLPVNALAEQPGLTRQSVQQIPARENGAPADQCNGRGLRAGV